MSDFNILSFYGQLLETAGMVGTVNGDIKVDVGGIGKIVKLNKLPLVLPTRENMKNLYRDRGVGRLEQKLEIFHPLLENELRRESPSLARLRKSTSIIFNNTISEIIPEYLNALNTSGNGVVSKELRNLLSRVDSIKLNKKETLVDDNSFRNLSKLINNGLNNSLDKFFIAFYINKGAKINKKQYKRITKVTFPFYKELCELNNDRVMYGVKLRIKDVHLLKCIFESMFPKIGDPDEYVFGTELPVSPGTISLTDAIYVVGTRLNNIISDKLTNGKIDSVKIKMGWVDTIGLIQDNDHIINNIPTTDDGELIKPKPKTNTIPWNEDIENVTPLSSRVRESKRPSSFRTEIDNNIQEQEDEIIEPDKLDPIDVLNNMYGNSNNKWGSLGSTRYDHNNSRDHGRNNRRGNNSSGWGNDRDDRGGNNSNGWSSGRNNRRGNNSSGWGNDRDDRGGNNRSFNINNVR